MHHDGLTRGIITTGEGKHNSAPPAAIQAYNYTIIAAKQWNMYVN